MLKKILILAFILFASSKVLAQDAQYSMYHANPLYLNPAFAGSTEGQRLVLNHRNQWPSIPITYQTYSASYDVNATVFRSGFGIQFNGDRAGSVGLQSSQLNLIYSYKVVGDHFTLSPGISFGIGNRSLDYDKLIFGDQLTFNTSSQTKPPTLDPAIFDVRNVNYFDFSAGVVMYNKDTWLGISAWHLNQPNRSFLSQSADLPIKISVHGGFKFELGNHRLFKKMQKEYIMPSFIYVRQAQFDQLSLGTQFLYDPIIVGVWYRGIAIRQNVSDQMSHDAVVVMIGFQFKKYDISYSYDATISSLAQVSGGAHEIAFRYNFNANLWKAKHRKKAGYIPCPAF